MKFRCSWPINYTCPSNSCINCSLAMSVGWSIVCCKLILYICTIRSELPALKARPFAHAVVWLNDTLLRARQQWMAQQACKSTNYRSAVCANAFPCNSHKQDAALVMATHQYKCKPVKKSMCNILCTDTCVQSTRTSRLQEVQSNT